MTTGTTDEHLRLAGFALAHAVWSIEDGETLCTLSLHERDGEREVGRYEAPSIPDSLEMAHEHLAAAVADGGTAAVVYDGYRRTDDGERRDALIVELFGSGFEPVGLVVQEYVPATRARLPFGRSKGFRLVGRPLVAGLPAAATETIVTGALEHEKARRHFAAL